MTDITKRLRFIAGLLLIISLLLNIGPLTSYVIIGFVESTATVEKVALSCTIFVVLILSAIAWVNKTSMRSRVWVLLLGLYFCLDHFITPLLIIAITQVLDEWIFSPLAKHYRNKYRINREIDRRDI